MDEFKGNSGGHKYNSIVVDPKTERCSIFFPTNMRMIYLNISHTFSPTQR